MVRSSVRRIVHQNTSCRVNTHRNIMETAANNAPTLRQKMANGTEKTEEERIKERETKEGAIEKIVKIKQIKVSILSKLHVHFQ